MLAFVVTCKGRLAALRETLPSLVATGCEVVLVDFDCPDRSGDWASAAHPSVRVVRVADAPRFHLTRARNLGAAAARQPWLCFIDADIAVAPGFLAAVQPLLSGARLLMNQGDPAALFGTSVMARADFERVGRFDEVMEGWGAEDRDLYVRLVRAGVRAQALPPGTFRALPHDDEARVRFYAEKDRWRAQRQNALYAQLKHDLARMLAVAEPPLALRRDLHAQVAAAVAAPGPVRLELELPIPAEMWFGERKLRRTWTYELE
jgi:hypothetical protein